MPKNRISLSVSLVSRIMKVVSMYLSLSVILMILGQGTRNRPFPFSGYVSSKYRVSSILSPENHEGRLITRLR